MTSSKNIFANEAPRYWGKGLCVVPVALSSKKPAMRGWQGFVNSVPVEPKQRELLEKYGHCGVGLLMGQDIDPGHVILGIDVDNDAVVALVTAVIGPTPSAKRGKKGLTLFVRAPKDQNLKSCALKDPLKRHVVDVLAKGRQTVLPPTPHPETGAAYTWVDRSVLEVDVGSLPIIDEERLVVLRVCLAAVESEQLITGQETHDPALRLVAKLVAAGSSDQETDRVVRALLPQDYEGDTLRELPGMIAGARAKGFAKQREETPYEPGEVGPIPLGYGQGEFIFRLQDTRQITRITAPQLAVQANLFSLAPKSFWEEHYGVQLKTGGIRIDVASAVDGLIQACRAKGVILPSNFRGIGLWREGDRLVPNFTTNVPESRDYLYIPPRQQVDLRRETLDIESIREFFQRMSWAVPNAGDVVLGWCMIAPLAGALEWRPHVAITGAAQSGKSTLIKGVSNLLRPLALTIEGNSTEAGIRQSIGCDARPVVIDEFETENSQDANRVGRVVRLMRSASSATGETTRGTPEGKALRFNLRAAFMIGAINLYRVSAADTSRIIRLELKAHASDQNSRRRIIELQEYLAAVAPAFCQFAIDQAENTITSIAVLHRHMKVIQARQADNMAAVLAGLWVALMGRAIRDDEAPDFLDAYDGIIREHGEAVTSDDAVECLNALLTHPIHLGQGMLRTMGSVLAETLAEVAKPGAGRPTHYDLLAVHGIRIDDGGFVVANLHVGATKIYASTRWAGGQWSQALSRLPGAKKVEPTRFGAGARSRGTWLPAGLVEESGVPRAPM